MICLLREVGCSHQVQRLALLSPPCTLDRLEQQLCCAVLCCALMVRPLTFIAGARILAGTPENGARQALPRRREGKKCVYASTLRCFCYPTTSAQPVPVLILHPYEIPGAHLVVTDFVIDKNTIIVLNVMEESKGTASVPGKKNTNAAAFVLCITVRLGCFFHVLKIMSNEISTATLPGIALRKQLKQINRPDLPMALPWI